ncbi:unnamed protein product [Diatraea saccharalis]|uniref:Uncharacterized protein n=1 Tax=Diatraea saccharalis TaxID=40085 RepID=A0A9P0CCA2_9NEOP|nr:unnamed protein product [Diatraea saccharalis]
MYWLAAFLVLSVANGAYAQATAQSSVAPELRECYMDPNLVNRNNLPPTTMPVLIDIIRKIENNPNITLDLRMLSTQLLHTYRQDGIEYHQRSTNVAASSIVLPFAPTFHSFHRHRLLLRIIPSNQQVLPNNTLPSSLKCALHNMISTTVDARTRGDESTCGSLSQYRALRTVRSPRSRRSIDDDVEILDLKQLSEQKNGHMMQNEGDSDVEYAEDVSSRQLLGDSACPILTGVVNTRWGAVSAGNLIAGIAAGSESQQVPILELTKGSVLNYQNVQPTITTVYPATLSGDLAEAVLVQGTAGRTTISVGNAGNWNSSQATRFYMLSGRTNIEMTDPEIRGALDGFFLGTSLPDTLRTFGSLKLSQLLDMYYTPLNGVFNTNLRACNRRELSQQLVVTNNLVGETRAFTAALDTVLPLAGTLTGGIEGLVDNSITNLQNYINNNLNDINCMLTTSARLDTRLRTNLYIVLDGSWQYQAVYPAISHIVESIDVGHFGSSITLLSASDGSVLINQTFSPADFHTEYTQQRHLTFPTGVNLQTSFANIRMMMQNQLRNETTMNYVGGNSTVLLFLLSAGNIENNANVLAEHRLLTEGVPDLMLLFATALNQLENLSNLVREPVNDITTISLTTGGTNVVTTMTPVVVGIQNVGRRIINPLCGADFVASSSGTRVLTQYVDPGYINYYRISPNYFYDSNGNTRVRVSRTGGVGDLVICHSRAIAVPRQNETFASVETDAVTCQTLGGTGNVELNLQNACGGFGTIRACPPWFFSVEAPAITTNPTATCTDGTQCRFPYDVAYEIEIQDLQCFSSGTNVAASFAILLFGIVINMLRIL